MLILVILVGMLVLRSGVFVARIVEEWNQPVSRWQPVNENEQMIWENYLQVGE